MTKGQPPTLRDLTGLGIHGCSQCTGSLRFDGADGAAGAGQGGKQEMSRTGDKAQAAGRADDAMTTTVRPLLFLYLFRERHVLANKTRVDRA